MKTHTTPVRVSILRCIVILSGAMLLPMTSQASKPDGVGKPDRAGQMKEDADSKEAEAKAKAKAEADKAKEKADKAADDATGLDKQKEKKAEQERKELGKGSEQGQAKRAEHSRKWWKFWGDKESPPPAETPSK